MPHQDPHQDPAPQYEETTDPTNPPASVLHPKARRAAVSTYVGGIVAFFLIVTGVYVYWASGNRAPETDDRTEASAVGTAGERQAEEPGVGGFDPQPDHATTREELEHRGELQPVPQPAGRAGTTTPLNELGSLLDLPQNTVLGRRIDVQGVDVERTLEGDTMWVRDGDARAAVIVPDGTDVRPGQQVNVSGTVESGSGGSVRIRATRVDVRE